MRLHGLARRSWIASAVAAIFAAFPDALWSQGPIVAIPSGDPMELTYMGIVLASLSIVGTGLAAAQAPPRGPGGPPPMMGSPLRVLREVEYARVGGRALHLDLYLRDNPGKTPLPVVMWVHGGAWMEGDKFPTPAARLVANGYAVASVEYRLSGEAKFPAQLYDLKAAVRWLRANAQQYNLDGTHIGAWGSSAGGHLVAMLGSTGNVKELEGDEGNPDQSSRVQAVVDFFGPIDLMRMDPTATRPKPYTKDLPEALLLGGPLLDNQAKAEAANPITYITPATAPFLIVHGSADSVVPPRQSEYLQIALKRAGVENDLVYVPGAGHDTGEVETASVADMVDTFFDKQLRNGKRQRDDVTSISEPFDSWQDIFPDNLAPTTYRVYKTPSRGPGTIASYRVYLPPGYDLPANAKRRYPVIYYLHGLNDDSRKSVTSGYIPRLDVAIRSGVMPATIVIAVQGLNHGWYVDSTDGKYPMESVIVKDLIPYVDKTYRTVATREGRAIEGHSMGGAGALHLGFKYPELFGSVASLSAALIASDQFTEGMNLDMLKTYFGGDIANYDAQGAWTLAGKDADRIRGRTNIRLICGDKDALLARSQWMSGILTRLKIPHTLTESHGAPHSVKEVLARLDSDPFEFYGEAFAAFR
jgi:acetyl esterase/lipase/esterase/lipase superfamily enzyme